MSWWADEAAPAYARHHLDGPSGAAVLLAVLRQAILDPAALWLGEIRRGTGEADAAGAVGPPASFEPDEVEQVLLEALVAGQVPAWIHRRR